MAVRVGFYTSNHEGAADRLVVDLGVAPSDEAVLEVLRSEPTVRWLCLVPAEGGSMTFLPLPTDMDYSGTRKLLRTGW